MDKVGVWIIGVNGAVASAVIAGAKGLAQGLSQTIGLVTELTELKDIGFLPFSDMVFGGHDIRQGDIKASFAKLAEEAHISRELTDKLSEELDSINADTRFGTGLGASKTLAGLARQTLALDNRPLLEIAGQIGQDIKEFQKRYNLRSVVVLNLASTEPPVTAGKHTETINGFEEALRADRKDLLLASTLYAYSAFKNKFPYINFTPSAGNGIPALSEYARAQGVPHCGRDGKTGETLIKSVLSTAFKYRALKVLSWQGYNILGNMDGKVLTDPASKESKIATKDGVLPEVLGYAPHTHTGIDYVPSLGDWKVAWDFIHFEGFLGTKMSMQFIWQGCDSMLAAPLALDLIRLAELAHRRGERGALRHTALFFKQPLESESSDLHRQWHQLWEYFRKELHDENH